MPPRTSPAAPDAVHEPLSRAAAEEILRLAKAALDSHVLPPGLRQRAGLEQIVEVLATARGEIARVCAGIDRDNAEHYSTMPSGSLDLLDATVRGIRAAVNKKDAPAPEAPKPVAAAKEQPTPAPVTTNLIVGPEVTALLTRFEETVRQLVTALGERAAATHVAQAIPSGNGDTRVPTPKAAPATTVVAQNGHERLMAARAHTDKYLDTELIEFGRKHGIITKSVVMEDALDTLRFLAEMPTGHVLIRGETGTGKELFSSGLHKASGRAKEPFILMDGAAVDSVLVKDELFGHEKGAFTGADKIRKGKVEIAGKGVLFLDEIGRWKPDVQGLLLGLVERQEYERVGSDKKLPNEARIVAATNANLEAMVREGLFIEDLYYRLQQFRIELPPLRDRGAADIELLASHFLTQVTGAHMKGLDMTFDDGALECLMGYQWPGNVRQLKHVVEQATVNAAREFARRKRIGNGTAASAKPMIMTHHIEDSLIAYRRLAEQAEAGTETAA